MFRTVNDFLQTWQIEAETTKRLLNNLTDEALAFGNEHFPRGVARLSQHMAESIPVFLDALGSKVPEIELWKTPESKQEVLQDYERASSAVTQAATELKDEQLAETVPFFGRPVPRGAVLSAIINHQTHHRGQLTVLMREAGLPGTSVYGPIKEDWAKMGEEARP